MQFHVISLFPEMFSALNVGVIGRALKNGLITVQLWNPRDYATDKHQSVDDRPYGGGPGMVMMGEPLKAALHAAREASKAPARVIYLSPQGQRFNQSAARVMCEYESLILLAGRYEGIDERILQQEVDAEWSIGDYILTGGEFAAMVMIDTIGRLIPGIVGDQDSVNQDSLSNGLLKHPQYTRPDCLDGDSVPAILKSGHHHQIRSWRLKTALGHTWLKRPDLLAAKTLNAEETRLLNEFIAEFAKNNPR